MSLACLVYWALPVRFVARPFSPLPPPSLTPLHSHQTPTLNLPGNAGEGSQGRGGRVGKKEKRFPQGHSNNNSGHSTLGTQSTYPPITTDHHPVGAPESKRTGQGQSGNIGTLGLWDFETLGHCWRRHTGQGPRKKDTWRNRRSESTYCVLTHPSSPTQSNPGRASLLPFHIHIPCQTGTGSGTGTTL